MRSRHWMLLLTLCAAFGGVALAWKAGVEAEGEPRAATAVSASESSQSLLMAFEPPQRVAGDDAIDVADDLFADVTSTVHADAVDVPVPLQPGRINAGAAPAQLPRVAEAQPIDAQTAGAASELEALLADELSHLDAEQRQVWGDVLQGMSPREALEIIQIWKATGGPLPQAATPLFTAPSTPAASSNDAALRSIVLTNLRHLDTPGYLRREPVAHHTAGGADSTSRLDLRPGELRITHNPLHLSIDGVGFFLLRRGDITACTRNGEFDLSESGELIQRRPDGDWSLDPVIAIPSDAKRVMIDADGHVAIIHIEEDSAVMCGRIQLVACLNPQHLVTLQDDLLQAGPRSGELRKYEPGAHEVGKLQQHALELSNATIETETEALDRWEQAGQLRQRAERMTASPETSR
jgi:flagellar basal body rod protein FlgG